jgi:hypothetical protein
MGHGRSGSGRLQEGTSQEEKRQRKRDGQTFRR